MSDLIDNHSELAKYSPKLDNENGELISRQAAIDEIDEWIKAFRVNGHKESAADACLIQDGIIQLPSVQPRKGKWIETEFLKLRECSCCHVRWGMYDVENFDFCPNCGCRMEEGDSDD